MIRRIACICICLAAASQLALAQSNTQINTDSGSFQLMDQGSNFLTAGPVGDGNGDVIQLGYYTGATNMGNNFLGTWVPLTGQGSANTAMVPGSTEMYNQTSIGDRNIDTGNTDGTFSLVLLFGVDSTSSQNLPTAGTLLSIRVYNGTTLGSSTFFNAVSNNAWAWQNPAVPPTNPVITMSLDQAGIYWESIVKDLQGSNTAFHTSISAIPEPTTVTSLLLGAGMLGLVVIRRRR